MDQEKMAQGIRTFLEGIGERFDGDDMEKTPQRVARAWAQDLAAGYATDPVAQITHTAAPPDAPLVIVRRISFASICVHHLLPFFGTAHVAYLPRERLAGLSKLGRVVDALARRLQTQENLTSGLVQAIDEALAPRGTVVVLEAEHTCMTLRGVRKEQSGMTTVAVSGLYATDRPAKAEVLALLSSGGIA